MRFTKPFSRLTTSDAATAGGKGASLGEMTQAGIPVPPGFVITADTFDYFTDACDLTQEIRAILHTVDTDAVHTVEKASEKIQTLIRNATIPEDIAQEITKTFTQLDTKYVAVRSSATAEDGADHAWAGQLDSFLNTTKETLLENVKKCWASLYTPRAIFYRFEKGLHTQHISVAVVVQKMVNSEKSGIAFSVHPVTEDPNQMIIEAGVGLGEAIVSGTITPDSYVVSKKDLPKREAIIDINVAEQTKALFRREGGGNEWRDLGEKGAEQVLSEEQILTLAQLIKKIEDHYSFPCDIEWAYENGRFYITQSRPITTLSRSITKDNNSLIEEEIIAGASENKAGEILVEELLHLDVPLAFVELHYEQEATKTIPWSDETFKISPYIFYKKHEGQVYFYYEPRGVDWQREQAGKYSGEDEAIKNIDTYFNKIKNILEEEKGLEKEELSMFLTDVRRLWSWMNYMWWAIEYREKNGEPFDALLSARKRTEYFIPGLVAVLRNSMKTIFPDLKNCADALLLSEVESGVVPNKATLEERLKGFAYTNYKLFDSWESLTKEFSVYVGQRISMSGNCIIGQSAYPGCVKGRVKIISSRKEIGKFERGEILVSSTTTPDYLPAMKRAAAIISEHGGAICHAAITSRELKIPCVVGVGGATQVLKDGDLVEVDADKGVVRILERAEEK